MKKYFLIYFILINFLVPAQNNNEVHTNSYESIVLSTDRDLYLSGEKIWFNAICLSNSKFDEETISKVTYFELFNEQKKVVLQKKIKIIKGKSSSYIKIPEDIETGMYNLVAYTQFMKNYKGFTTNRISLLIINPKKKGDVHLTHINKQHIDSSVSINDFNLLKISTDKKDYKTKEEVKLTITDNIYENEFKHLTISVIKKGSLNNYSVFKNKQIIQNKLINFDQIIYYPEIRDLTLSGTVFEKGTDIPIPNSKVYLSVLDADNQMSISKTDKKGRFAFTLNSLYNENDIYISTGDETVNSDILINNSFLSELDYFKPITYYLDSSKIKQIKEMYLNYQSSIHFPEYTKILKIDTPSNKNYFGDSEIFVKLDDYINLPTLSEVFSEIITFVFIKKSKKGSSFLIYDDKNRTSYTEPLVIYDNIPIFDVDKLLKVAPKYIDEIKVINRKYIIGNYTINGIIFIKSKMGKLPGYEIPENSIVTKYQTTYGSAEIKFPEHLKGNNKNSHLPDFRTLLYWDSDLILKDIKKVNFYTSNHSSEYDVIVRGISASGEIYFGKTSINVQK